jgi:hypothetical protein
MIPPARPVCGNCQYFFVTHDPARPWGCRAFGFRAAQLPNSLVFASTGTNCARFDDKRAVMAPVTGRKVRKPS